MGDVSFGGGFLGERAPPSKAFPHSGICPTQRFGWRRPKVCDSYDTINKKKDLNEIKEALNFTPCGNYVLSQYKAKTV